MTSPQSPRIDLNPGKTQRMDFDSFAMLNLPGKRAGNLRLAFKLIWIAHQVFPAMHNRKGLRIAHYWHFKQDIDELLSKKRKEEVILPISKNALKKVLRYMRKAGYIRYVPFEDLWHFSGKASGALRKIANQIDKCQESAKDRRECEKIIHDFCFGL